MQLEFFPDYKLFNCNGSKIEPSWLLNFKAVNTLATYP